MRTVIFFGLDFAHKHYFSTHKKIFEQENIISISIDKAPFLSKGYSRRSVVTLPLELIYFVYLMFVHRPDLVISAGPKVGLLATFSSLFFRNTTSVHWFTGQVWANHTQKYKSLAFYCDKLISIFANKLFCDSKSQRQFLITNLTTNTTVFVPEFGSMNGIAERYHLSREDMESLYFRKMAKNNNVLKVCFVGRKAKGKGLEIIPQLTALSAEVGLSVHFYLAGPKDESFREYTEWVSQSKLENDNITFIDDYVDPIEVFDSCHALILPSEREGFGTVVVEAQSRGLPVICSNIYGLQDSFLNNITGFRCNSLSEYLVAIEKLIDENTLEDMSFAAFEFSQKFKFENFIESLRAAYKKAGLI